ncbi:MAG: ECF transporter S component [Armatimonadota bacterium]
MSAQAQNQELTRYGLPRWRVSDVLWVAAIGIIGGLLYRFVFPAVSAACGAAETQPWSSLTNGVWMLAGFLALGITRRPGSMILAESLAALLSVLLSGQTHAEIELAGKTRMVLHPLVFTGLLQGMGGETIFCLLRYAEWRFGVWLISAAGCAWFSYISGIYVTKCYVLFPATVQAGIFLGTFLSTAALCALPAWWLGRRLFERSRP